MAVTCSPISTTKTRNKVAASAPEKQRPLPALELSIHEPSLSLWCRSTLPIRRHKRSQLSCPSGFHALGPSWLGLGLPNAHTSLECSRNVFNFFQDAPAAVEPWARPPKRLNLESALEVSLPFQVGLCKRSAMNSHQRKVDHTVTVCEKKPTLRIIPYNYQNIYYIFYLPAQGSLQTKPYTTAFFKQDMADRLAQIIKNTMTYHLHRFTASFGNVMEVCFKCRRAEELRFS